MPNPRLANRYAKSLIDLAIERNELEKIYADIQLLTAITKGSRDFSNMLRSPIINPDTKKRIINAVLTDKVTDLTKSFIQLLIIKGREGNLSEICTAFVEQYKDYKNIYTVKLTTAAPLSDDLKTAIINQVKATSDMQNIELETAVDKKLIGGFVLEAGDKLVDASVAYDLKLIAKQFENNDFIYKVR